MVTAFLFGRSETEDRLASTCGFHLLECENVLWILDWRSSSKRASVEGLNDCVPLRFDPGGTHLALLKTPITASGTRGVNSIRSSLKLSSDNSGTKANHRRELPPSDNMVYSAQGPMGRLAGQLTGEWRSGDRCDAVETSESMFNELRSSDKACTKFDETRQVNTTDSCSRNLSLHACRIHEHSCEAGAGQTRIEGVWRRIDLLPKQSLRVDGNLSLDTEKTNTVVGSRLGPPEESTGEMPALDICRKSPLGEDFNRQNGCPDITSLSNEGKQEELFPVRLIVEANALAVDSNQRGDEAGSEEGYLALEAKNGSNDLRLNINAAVNELEQRKRDLGREASDREDFNEEDNDEAAQEIDACDESFTDEADESFHMSGTCAEDTSTASKEDDIWSDEALISSQAKGFPPPISILANESHPFFPSHMPRTLWRSVKRGGRFVLQELQARPREYFRATRQNGRLRLQLIRPDSDPVLRIPDEIEDLQLGEGGIESRQLDEDGLPRIPGDDGAPGEIIERYGPSQIASDQIVKKMVITENSGISTSVESVEAGETADNNECERCSNIRENTTTVFSNENQSRQDFQHAHCVSTFGFDNSLNILSPSKTFFQLPPLTHIQPAVR